MDKANLVVLLNMTAALVVAGFVTWLFHTGRWPKNSPPKENQTVSKPEEQDGR